MTTYDFGFQARRRAVGRPIDPPPNALVATLFGRGKWREWLHPRDRNGRWIEKDSRVKVHGWGGDSSVYVGDVQRLNRDGTVSVRVAEGPHAGSVLKAAPHQVEEIAARAMLPSRPVPPAPPLKADAPRAPWAPNRPILIGAATDLGSTYADLRRALTGRAVVTFDYETTGLHPEAGHRGVEVAAVRTLNGRVVDRFHTFMNPGRPIDPEASKVTGITDADVANAPSHEDAAKQLRDFIGDDLVSAYNASFDVGFLQASLRDAGEPDWEPSGVIDPLSMARSLVKAKSRGGPVENHKLESLAAFFGVDLTNAHAADADTEATAQLLHALIRYGHNNESTFPNMKALETRWRSELPAFQQKLDAWLETVSQK